MNRDDYARMLDGLGAETIDRYDREESGGQCGAADRLDEYRQAGGAFGFGALDRERQIDILRALDENLPTRTKRPNGRTGTSYALKHIVERFTGFYVSNLQAKTAMRVLGYERSADQLNPVFNVSAREWRAFNDLSREADARRQAAQQSINRQRERQQAARYFHRLGRTA